MESVSTSTADSLMRRARMLQPADGDYPAVLLDASVGAPTLWAAGEIPRRCVAIVGTRRPDLGGLRAARALGRSLAESGWAVVSGGAVGCDSEAHQGALEAGGRTVVVLGSGLARPYPRESLDLMLRATEAGAVLSPFPPETEPLPALFHRRNRILAALGVATVVVRAGRRSGALSTAEHARRMGRRVLAVPGSTSCAAAEGSNLLLRDGCPVALDATDVLRAIGEAGGRTAEGSGGNGERSSGRTTERPGRPGSSRQAGYAPARSVAGGGDPLLDLLGGGEAAGADELAEASGLAAAEVVARLGRLEIEGRVARSADGRFRAALERR